MTFFRQSSWWLPVIGFAAVSLTASAETINFYCPPNRTNLTSSGVAMDASFQFQLGVFSGGFVPTKNNLVEWSGRWTPVIPAADYGVGSSSFDENHTITNNIAPFLAGTAAYVWGKRSSSGGDEWILFRNSDWNWPSPNPFNPFPLDWNAALADQVIIGSINGPGHLMKSEAVLSYSQWQNTALAGESLNTPSSDPDRDGVENLLEFLFGSDPKQSGAGPQMQQTIVEVGGQEYLQCNIPRLRGRLAALTVMVSSDLIDWQFGPAHTVEVSSASGSWVVRDLTPIGPAHPKRFIKLKAVLP